MTTTIETVNKNILKGFKSLQKNKNILYTIANNSHLTSICDKTMIVYSNPTEIDFEGTFKLIRSKLISLDENLCSIPNIQSQSNFTKLKSFNKLQINNFQKYCYENSIFVNIADIIDPINKLFDVYNEFTLYSHLTKSEILISFQQNEHKTVLISKLL